MAADEPMPLPQLLLLWTDGHQKPQKPPFWWGVSGVGSFMLFWSVHILLSNKGMQGCQWHIFGAASKGSGIPDHPNVKGRINGRVDLND